jgi:hypothetical protein
LFRLLLLLLLPFLQFLLPLPLPAPSYGIGIKMGLIDLPVELLEIVIDYTIPKNWKYYSEEQWVLNLRLLCSKPFIFIVPFCCSTADFFCLFQDLLIILFHSMHSAN